MSIAGTLCRASVIAFAVVASACTVRTGPPVTDAYVYSSPPPNINSAPRGYYAGETYYYHNDHWWHRSPNGWAYLREEPAPLHRYRPGVAQPPPAYYPPGRPYGYGGGPGGTYVPPPLPAPR